MKLNNNELSISHNLTNVGTKPMLTDVYSHPMINIDGNYVQGKGWGATTSGYQLVLPFQPICNLDSNLWRLARIFNTTIYWMTTMNSSDIIYCVFGGNYTTVKDNQFTVQFQNNDKFIGVTKIGDNPLEQYRLSSTNGYVAPEAYVNINLKPGESKQWKEVYNFWAT